MNTENKTLDFNNQTFFLGLDVHQKNWRVNIRSGKLQLKSYSMNPSPKELSEYMNKNYPGGDYYSVYEAGFCGYWIHRELEKYGIKNIIVSPNQVPTTTQERTYKTDKIDAGKLARELENGTLEGIYVPEPLVQEMRGLIRLRVQLTKAQTRIKNQIKSYLNFYGQKIPENYQTKHWSGKFIKDLSEMKFEYEIGKTQLDTYLEELIEKRNRLANTIKQIKAYCKKYNFNEDIQLLMSVPGIGFTTASTLYFELIDMKRFPRLDNLASYVGLSPSISSSGERETNLGIKQQHNRYLRNLLIEAAWVAVRNDPALTMCFNNYFKRMSKQEAIVRIAKKLLNRIMTVWKNKKQYVCSVVK